MSSTTKPPSVTPLHTAAALKAMMQKVRTHTDTSFFAHIRQDPVAIEVICADHTVAQLTKQCVSTSRAFRGIGYDVDVTKPGMPKETYYIWIRGPSQDREVNRYYLICVLQDIIDNPHAGKKTFNGGRSTPDVQ
ncbi:hypothetical protein K474DRAFT_1662534 [Panus rudis PR-1116 ss-1]|nr:hypothetical protein K474DRAFT_1662534 [Panus rudis PR-1116 ss-1]